MKLVIGFAGPIGAGKTTGATYLQKTRDFAYVRYSAVLAEWRNAGLTKPQLQATGWEVMSSGLQEELNRRVIALIEPSRDTAVDGLRHPIDEASMRSRFGGAFALVYVNAPEEERWERTAAMGRFGSVEEFRAADRHDVENPLRALRSLADVVIDNADSLEEYVRSIDAALASVRRPGGEQ
jgi:dephospho-CoA kinase